MFDPRENNVELHKASLRRLALDLDVRSLIEEVTASVFELDMGYEVPGVTEYLTELQVSAPPFYNLLPKHPTESIHLPSLREAIFLGEQEAEFPTRQTYAQYQEDLGRSLLFLSSREPGSIREHLHEEEISLSDIYDLKNFGKNCYSQAALALEEVVGTIETLPSKIFFLYEDCIEVLTRVRAQFR